MSGLAVEWRGVVPYAEALAIQEAAVDARYRRETGDRLLLFEHPPVVTFGSGARRENLRVSEAELDARGVARHRVRRGGDVTYHGPGQLVGYPIVDLAARGSRDAHAFLREIEAALIDGLASLSVPARRAPGLTGVFVGATEGSAGAPTRKIASIGVGLRRWITYHGFALNVGSDLRGFDAIVPCGLAGVPMTSVARELSIGDDGAADLERTARRSVADAFRRRFACWPSPSRAASEVAARSR